MALFSGSARGSGLEVHSDGGYVAAKLPRTSATAEALLKPYPRHFLWAPRMGP